jgi:hypothetical protein
MIRLRGLLSFIFVFGFAASAAANQCSFEALCGRTHPNYVNARKERIRLSLRGVNLAIFDTVSARKRARRVFNEAKEVLLGVIRDEPLVSEAARESMRERVKAASLQLQRGGRAPYAAIFWPDSWEVLADTSVTEMPESNLFNLFAHELSHSFDPDTAYYSLVWEQGGIFPNDEKANPPRVGHPRRILAQPIERYELIPLISLLKMAGIEERYNNESLCDRFATQASVRYLLNLPEKAREVAALEAQMDLVVTACSETGKIDEPTSSYPSLRTRVETLYFGNAEISRMAGCRSGRRSGL